MLRRDTLSSHEVYKIINFLKSALRSLEFFFKCFSINVILEHTATTLFLIVMIIINNNSGDLHKS